MPGVILRNISGNNQGEEIQCDIIDYDLGADAVVPFDIAAPGWSVHVDGDKYDTFQYIYPTYAKCNIMLRETAHFDFFNSLKVAREGRYFVQILKDETIVFIGKIIAEDMQLQDSWKPVYSFSAIDGLTDLKGIDFEYDANDTRFVRNIFKVIFNKIPIKDFYPASGPVWGFQSDIVPDNISMYAGNMMNILYVNNYMYRIENGKRVEISCWDVLEELLKRLHLSIKSWGGIFWVTGQEGNYLGRETEVHYYDKNTVFVASSVIVVDYVGFDQIALTGGIYTFASGYKKVVIEADKTFSNRYLGSDILWDLNFNEGNYYSPGYQLFGKAKAATAYKVRIAVNLMEYLTNDNTKPSEGFAIKMNIRVVGGAAIAIDREYIIPYYNGVYTFEFPINSAVVDRDIECTFDIDTVAALNVTNININVNATMTEVTRVYDKIKYIAKIDASKNPKTKTIKQLGNHQNGTNAVRFSFYQEGSLSEYTKDFSFASGGGVKALEVLIAENILAYSGNTETLELPINVVLNPAPFNIYTYGDAGFVYILNGYTLYPHDGRSEVLLIKKNVAQTGITTEQEIPLAEDANIGTTNAFGHIELYANVYHAEFENVTDDYVVPDDDLAEYFTGESADIKKTWSIFLNGVKQQYKDVAVVSYPPDPGELNMAQYTYFAATNRLYFGLPLEDSFIEIKYSKL